MEWFGSVDSLESLKGEYLNYLRKWKNDTDVMSEINLQYQSLLESLGVEYNIKIEQENEELPLEKQKPKFEAKADKFAEVLNKIIYFNMKIEIIGQWSW